MWTEYESPSPTEGDRCLWSGTRKAVTKLEGRLSRTLARMSQQTPKRWDVQRGTRTRARKQDQQQTFLCLLLGTKDLGGLRTTGKHHDISLSRDFDITRGTTKSAETDVGCTSQRRERAKKATGSRATATEALLLQVACHKTAIHVNDHRLKCSTSQAKRTRTPSRPPTRPETHPGGEV